MFARTGFTIGIHHYHDRKMVGYIAFRGTCLLVNGSIEEILYTSHRRLSIRMN